MSYSVSISGHSDKTTPEEIEAEARKFVAALDGVSYATLSDSRGSTNLMKEKE